MPEKLKFHQTQWFTWLAIVFFAPLGIFFLWKNKFYSPQTRGVITGIFAILFLVSLIPKNQSTQTNSTTSPSSYKQTSAPTQIPTVKPTSKPTVEPTTEPTAEPTTDPKEIEKDFKDACQSIPYKSLARNPSQYLGNALYFKGEVLQVMESGRDITLRVSVSKSDYGYTASDVLLVTYRDKGETDNRILEKDMVKIYGQSSGIEEYKTVLGAQVKIPSIVAKYIDIVE